MAIIGYKCLLLVTPLPNSYCLGSSGLYTVDLNEHFTWLQNESQTCAPSPSISQHRMLLETAEAGSPSMWCTLFMPCPDAPSERKFLLLQLTSITEWLSPWKESKSSLSEICSSQQADKALWGGAQCWSLPLFSYRCEYIPRLPFLSPP